MFQEQFVAHGLEKLEMCFSGSEVLISPLATQQFAY